jgi:hypothetical protein
MPDGSIAAGHLHQVAEKLVRVATVNALAFTRHIKTTMEALFKHSPDLPRHVDLNLWSLPPPPPPSCRQEDIPLVQYSSENYQDTDPYLELPEGADRA